MTAATASKDPDLIRAIHDDRLSSWADSVLADPEATLEARTIASHAAATCSTIHAETTIVADTLTAALRSAGVESTTTTSDQRHTIVIDVAPGDAERAIEVLNAASYRGPREWAGAAARSFLRFGGSTVLTRSGTQSSVVRLRWRRSASSRSKLQSLVRSIITPTSADWAIADLPERLWWVYGALRPFRLIAERLGVASDEHGDLEPFLVTPDALLEPLFAVAEIDDTDVFADIGCGDGRIVVAAARQRGCRAIGVEQSADSVSAARRHVDAAGLSDRVRIVHADAQDADLSEATVALFFVPMVVASRLVPLVLSRLADGGQVVLHEQSPMPSTLPSPIDSTAIIATDAVTVAHQWVRSQNR